MTPSTNKCCEKCRVGDAFFSAIIDAKNNPEHDCPCHHKPKTEPIEELVERFWVTHQSHALSKEGWTLKKSVDALLPILAREVYETGQVEMGKWVLYENTGGRAGIQNKIEDIAATLKAKTDI